MAARRSNCPILTMIRGETGRGSIDERYCTGRDAEAGDCARPGHARPARPWRFCSACSPLPAPAALHGRCGVPRHPGSSACWLCWRRSDFSAFLRDRRLHHVRQRPAAACLFRWAHGFALRSLRRDRRAWSSRLCQCPIHQARVWGRNQPAGRGRESLFGVSRCIGTGLQAGAGSTRRPIPPGGVQARRRIGCGRVADRSPGLDSRFCRPDNQLQWAGFHLLAPSGHYSRSGEAGTGFRSPAIHHQLSRPRSGRLLLG